MPGLPPQMEQMLQNRTNQFLHHGEQFRFDTIRQLTYFSNFLFPPGLGGVIAPGDYEVFVTPIGGTCQGYGSALTIRETNIEGNGGRIPDEAMGEYWKAFESPAGRQGILELYRSGDFEKLKPYEGQLRAMGVPALILWGENDPVVPVAAAHRFDREISDSKMVILEDASHFLYDDEPARCAREIVAFLDQRR